MAKSPNIKVGANGFAKGMGTINSALKTTQKAWETFKSALKNGDPTSSIAALATSFTAVKGAAGVVVNVGKSVVNTFKDFASAGMKATDELDRMTTMLGSRTKANSLLGTIDQLEDISWESGEAISAFAQKLIGAGKDADDVEKILTATVDICNTTGRSFGEVSTAIENAFAGKTKTIEKIIPGLKDLGDQAWDSGDAIKYIGDELHDASITIASGSFSNQLGAIANSWQRIKENIGATIVTNLESTGILQDIYSVLGFIERNTNKKAEEKATTDVLKTIFSSTDGFQKAMGTFGAVDVESALQGVLSGESLAALLRAEGVAGSKDLQADLEAKNWDAALKKIDNMSITRTGPALDTLLFIKDIIEDIRGTSISGMLKAIKDQNRMQQDAAEEQAEINKQLAEYETWLKYFDVSKIEKYSEYTVDNLFNILDFAQTQGFPELAEQVTSVITAYSDKVAELETKSVENTGDAIGAAVKEELSVYETWLKSFDFAKVTGYSEDTVDYLFDILDFAETQGFPSLAEQVKNFMVSYNERIDELETVVETVVEAPTPLAQQTAMRTTGGGGVNAIPGYVLNSQGKWVPYWEADTKPSTPTATTTTPVTVDPYKDQRESFINFLNEAPRYFEDNMLVVGESLMEKIISEDWASITVEEIEKAKTAFLKLPVELQEEYQPVLEDVLKKQAEATKVVERTTYKVGSRAAQYGDTTVDTDAAYLRVARGFKERGDSQKAVNLLASKTGISVQEAMEKLGVTNSEMTKSWEMVFTEGNFLTNLSDKLGAALGDAIPGTTLEQSQIAGGTIVDSLLGNLGEAGDKISGLANNMATMGPVLGGIVTAIQYVLEGFGEIVAEPLNDVLELIVEPLRELGRMFGSLLTPIISAIKMILQPFSSMIMSIIDTVGRVIMPALQVLTPLIQLLQPIFDILNNVLQQLLEPLRFFGKIITAVSATFEWVYTFIASKITELLDSLASISIDLGFTIPGWVPWVGGNYVGATLTPFSFLKPGSVVKDPGSYSSFVGNKLSAYDESVNMGFGQTPSQSAATGSTSASYGGATTVHFYLNVENSPIVGSDGFHELAGIIKAEFAEMGYYNV